MLAGKQLCQDRLTSEYLSEISSQSLPWFSNIYFSHSLSALFVKSVSKQGIFLGRQRCFIMYFFKLPVECATASKWCCLTISECLYCEVLTSLWTRINVSLITKVNSLLRRRSTCARSNCEFTSGFKRGAVGVHLSTPGIRITDLHALNV